MSGLPFPDGCCRGFPVEQNQVIDGPNAFAPAGSMATGIPAPSLVPIPENGILVADGPLLTQNFTNVLLEPRHLGQLHSWNVAYQRTLPGAFTAEVAYVGNRQTTLGTTRISMRAWSSARIAPARFCSTSSAEPGLLR